MTEFRQEQARIDPAKDSRCGPSAAGPKVSVIVPTCNRPGMLTDAVQSILDQTFRDFEVIVVNDAGADIETLVRRLDTEGRITTVRHNLNRGLAAARNTGLRLARGRYITYLDDDDLYYPDHLETLVETIEAEGCRVVYTDANLALQEPKGDQYVTKSKSVAYSWDFSRKRMLVTNFIPVLCVMHERSCIEASGLFDESLKVMEDHDLWLRISENNPFLHVKKTTCEFRMRTDSTNMSDQRRSDFISTHEELYRRYRPSGAMAAEIEQHRERFLMDLRLKEKPARNAESCRSCSVIIPVHNNRDYTFSCLQALARNTEYPRYEVVVVDNGSTDDTPALLESFTGDMKVIRNAENLGFARACNQGAEAAEGDYLVFLNNDTVVQPGWLTAMVDAVEAVPEAAVIGSRLIYPDGTIQHAGLVVLSRLLTGPYHIYRGVKANDPKVMRMREFTAVTGACMLTRREVFEAVRGFDEGYCNAFEDVDFCLRVRETGGRVIYTPKSVVVHFEGKTEGREDRVNESWRHFLTRWDGKLENDEDQCLDEDGVCIMATENGGAVILPKEQQEDCQELSRAMDLEKVCDFDQAIEQYEEVTMKIQGNEAALQGLGRCYMAMGDLAKAEEALDRLVRTSPTSQGHLNLAKLYIKQGKIDKAMENLEVAKELNGADDEVAFEILTTLGDCHVKSDCLDEAEEHYRMAIQIPTGSERPMLGLGSIALLRQDYIEAKEYFGKAAAMNTASDKAMCGIAISCWIGGDKENGYACYKKALALNPLNMTALYSLVRASYELDTLDEAARYLSSYLERNPVNLDVLFSLGGVCCKLGRGEMARSCAEKILALDPAHEGALAIMNVLNTKESACFDPATTEMHTKPAESGI